MKVGSSYSLSLLATISGKLRLVSAKLVATSDSSNAAAAAAITEHNAYSYKLPDNLKAVDIYGQLFHHFVEAGSGTTVVIPEAYINQTTVVEVTQVSKTVVFTLPTAADYALLVNVLNDHGFSYRVV